MESPTPHSRQLVMSTPRSVDIAITARCNLRCSYCYFFDNPANRYEDLPTGAWLTFFDELGRNGVMDVCLAGGEPFIREDLKDIIQGVVSNRMRFSISSNGSLITDSMASFIAGTGRCNQVQVSVDGSRPETHDACRGRGSFDGALRGIKTLQRNAVRVAVRVTIHRHNVNDLEAISRLLLEDLGLPGFSTNSAGYLGSCQSHSASILLSTEDRTRSMEMLLELSMRYPGRINALAGPLAEARTWQAMEQARQAGDAQHLHRGSLTGCGCPSKQIAVRSDGKYVPCPMLSHMVLGEINQDPLEMVWLESPGLANLRRRRMIPLVSFEFCAGCEYAPYCTGNCPGLAHAILGKIDHPSPDACLRQFLAAGGSLPTINSDVSQPPLSPLGDGGVE